jgi:hypothetical protein
MKKLTKDQSFAYYCAQMGGLEEAIAKRYVTAKTVNSLIALGVLTEDLKIIPGKVKG